MVQVDFDELGAETVRPEIIKELRAQHAMTQRDLADAWGKSQTIVSQIESGERSLSRIAEVKRLAKVFGVPPAILLGPEFTGIQDREAYERIAKLPPEKRRLLFEMADALAKAA